MNYKTMQKYIANGDYIHITSINGIDFYTPNNEDWGDIVAVHHDFELTKHTSFYEMDDMLPPSDYEIVAYEGELICKYEIEIQEL